MTTNHYRNFLILMICFLATHLSTAQIAGTILFDAKNEWYTYLSKSGKNNDPLKVFTFENEVLHISGEDFGYISTKKMYRNFHLTLWFRWGEKKFAPRENAKRDSGILYLTQYYSGDKVWPRSIEFQIQEEDCGDFWMTDSTTIVYHDTLTKPEAAHRKMKYTNAEKPHGEWNKVEVTVSKNKITHTLNDTIVNEGTSPNVKEGYIVLQSEGAEIYYKHASVKELKE
jgi:hypothetical protein